MPRFKPMPRGRRVPEFDYLSPTGGKAGRAAVGKTDLPPLRAPRGLRPEFTVPACWRVTRVAAYLDVSKKRVYQMIDEGKLEAVSVGPRGTRVLRASIDRFLEGKKADA